MDRLKIAIVSGILHPRYGGPPSVIQAHIKGLVPYADTTVFGVADPGDEEELKKIYPGCRLFLRTFPKRWFRGKGLREALMAQAGDFDVIHSHMLWDYAVWASWKAAKKNKKSLIVTPHGSILNVWRWKPLHKVFYRELIMKRLFKDCAFVHALNAREEKACLDFGVKSNIRIIPNGLSEMEYLKQRSPGEALQKWPQLRGRRVLLFMGRLSQLKGLDILPQAWANCLQQTKTKDWILVIAGPDYRGFQVEVDRRIKELSIENWTLITGPVFGSLKDSLLTASEAFVLPSYTEGFSMAILEAIAANLPCLYSTECHFPELAQKEGGLEIEPKLDSLVQALIQVVNQSFSDLKKMGQKANELGRQKYTLEKVAQQLIGVYREATKKNGNSGFF